MATPLTTLTQRRAMAAWRTASEKRAELAHARALLVDVLFYVQVVAATSEGESLVPARKSIARIDERIREAIAALDRA